ncbi:M4 family metallopeptidase [Lapillicoccus sp.]|uniref:M4 family metallopeptidase n=1 Tax=Lapillicoccus sp. TaxID=1909287 RepID=UPI00344CDB1F
MSPRPVTPHPSSRMPRPASSGTLAPVRCGITPPYLLEQLALVDEPEVADAARRAIIQDQGIRDRREVFTERGGGDHRGLPGAMTQATLRGPAPAAPSAPSAPPSATGVGAVVKRAIHDAGHTTTLPGPLVRKEGAPATSDVAATEAYDGLGATWGLLHTAYGRDSLDGKGLLLVASVHYDTGYDNAFWDGTQMVFGDGDGVYFNRFTAAVDVIGHELTHGMTQFTAGLTYVAQPGALNESVSDCFGSMVKQMVLGQSAADADWLIGQGLFTSKVNGVALRSMKAPGTAYDDPKLGKDPQAGDMDGYQDLPHDSQHDNGGVHTNSGIPNRAFYLAATGIGGTSWEGAGQVWYDVLTGGKIAKDAQFADFAQLTIDAATARFGAGSSQVTAVHDAWTTVKVI